MNLNEQLGQKIMDDIIEAGIINAVDEKLMVWDAGACDVLETIFNRYAKEREQAAWLAARTTKSGNILFMDDEFKWQFIEDWNSELL